jgi:hypothetical protein
MSDWSLSQLLASLHDDIQQRLAIARKAIAHPGGKGDASESVWVKLLETYLPRRYQVSSAHVVDSKGTFSDQIDVVIFDRQYSPFIFHYEGQTIIPAESVYAVFEAKQTIDAHLVHYAQAKVSSVRSLCRTSLPIPHAGGTYPAKPLPSILGGILSLESDWNPPLGASLREVLSRGSDEDRLDLGCVAAHGVIALKEDGTYSLTLQEKPATAFLFELIARLQTSATVPMIDISAYAKWLL